jgi:transmembrane sensor
MNLGKQDAPANASEWLSEAGNEELTPSQRAALADWLRESPVHVREFLQMTLIQQDLGELNISPEQIESWVNEAKSAAKEPTWISSNVELPTAKESSSAAKVGPVTSRIGRWPVGWLSAACLVVALLVGGLIFRWQEGRYTTAFGEQRIVTLADGSVIDINTDSALQVRFTEHQRAIHMSRGEAFFRVAHDTSRPFVVSAGEAVVKAVGTQFNVRMGSASTLVSVVEGAVEVRDETPAGDTAAGVESAVRVTTGEEATITPVRLQDSKKRRAVAKIASSSAQRSASWTRGRVEFENTPLGDVLREFQRYRDVQVTIDDESIRQLKLTGSFEAHDPDSALAFIATLPGISVEEIDAHTFRIHRRNQRQTSRP